MRSARNAMKDISDLDNDPFADLDDDPFANLDLDLGDLGKIGLDLDPFDPFLEPFETKQ
jgi:hypothetical protein